MILGVGREAVRVGSLPRQEILGKLWLTRRISTDKKCQTACGFLAERRLPEVHDPKLLC